jgi:hypothetical protein
VPGDAKQVARVYIPQTYTPQIFFDFGGYPGRLTHLSKGWDNNVSLTHALDGTLAAIFFYSKVDFHSIYSSLI